MQIKLNDDIPVRTVLKKGQIFDAEINEFGVATINIGIKVSVSNGDDPYEDEYSVVGNVALVNGVHICRGCNKPLYVCVGIGNCE